MGIGPEGPGAHQDGAGPRPGHAAQVDRGLDHDTERAQCVSNVAVLVGSRVGGMAGAAVAFFATVLPGFAILMVLGAFALDSHLPWVGGALRGCAAMAVGLTLANTIELTAKRINVVDIAIVAAVAAFVLVLHASLALTLAIFIPVALVLTRPKSEAS